MNWSLIFLCSGFGVLMGLAAMMGWTEGLEWMMWAVVMLIVALVLGLKAQRKFFMHGFWAAAIAAVFSTVIELIFWDSFLANNSKLAEAAEQLPEGWNLKSWMALSAPFTAGVSGVVQGLLALLFGKLLGEKQTPSPPPPAQST